MLNVKNYFSCSTNILSKSIKYGHITGAQCLLFHKKFLCNFP